MLFPRRLLIVIGVLSLVAITVVRMPHRQLPLPLPTGKVKPFLSDGLLLAPDGTLWKLSHSGGGGPTSLTWDPFTPGADWREVSGSASGGLGIKQDGSLWLWRTRFTSARSAPIFEPPIQIGLERDWAHVRHDWNYAPLLKSDGSLWYLGDEFIDSKTRPSQLNPAMRPSPLGTDRDWVTITHCNGVCYAIKKDGTLWQWGNTSYGPPFETTPRLFSPDQDWSALTSCGFALAALKKDGSLWISGANAHVVALDYVHSSAAAPVRIGPESYWEEIIGGEESVVARHRDGSWWASGENHYAHLGLPHWLGHSKHLSKPTRIPIDLEVWAWFVRQNTTLLLTRDGSIYYMGKTPGSGRAIPTRMASLKQNINRQLPRLGLPPPFARPGETWSQRPVKIGELPPSVISALQEGG